MFVGRHATGMFDAIHSIKGSSPVQLDLAHEFIPEADIAVYYNIADVALVTHPRHIGVSVVTGLRG